MRRHRVLLVIYVPGLETGADLTEKINVLGLYLQKMEDEHITWINEAQTFKALLYAATS
jgi:hypothetical protein